MDKKRSEKDQNAIIAVTQPLWNHCNLSWAASKRRTKDGENSEEAKKRKKKQLKEKKLGYTNNPLTHE